MNFDLQTIALIAGAVAVIFWPVIRDSIKSFRASKENPESVEPSQPVQTVGPRNGYMLVDDCPCVETPEPVEEKSKSDWVAESMAIRNYVEKRRLSKAVDACDVLIAEIVSGKPDNRIKAAPRPANKKRRR